MRLKQFLAEASADELKRWVDSILHRIEFDVDVSHRAQNSSVKLAIDEAGKLKFQQRGEQYRAINIGDHNEKWDCPASPNDWAGLHDKTFTFDGLVLESFKHVPNCRKIIVSDRCTIRSFTGIEALTNLEVLSLRRPMIEAGVLSFLKAPKLRTVILNKAFSLDTFVNEKLEEIIDKHLEGDRDIAECAEELIDIGLGDYAKL